MAAPSSSSSSSSAPSGVTQEVEAELRRNDKIYEYDSGFVERLTSSRQEWVSSQPRKFSKCRVSALAAMKMLQHAIAGVEKGRARGTNPVEVMGLMIGKPTDDTLYVTDTWPLPVEGTETRVVADEAMGYMTRLVDQIELRREDRFIGWYHSHPFDVTTYSHCHLSATDVQTQSQWQFMLPQWCAIVVDPLRSIAKQEPVFGAFRCYPPEHNPPKNVCPDGTDSVDDRLRIQRWGVSHHRYYALDVEFFMSSLGHHIINLMSRNSLWVRVLSSSAVMEPENRERFAERVNNATQELDTAAHQMPRHSHMSALPGVGKRPGKEELRQGARASSELALEQIKGHISQVAKNLIFNNAINKAAADDGADEDPDGDVTM